MKILALDQASNISGWAIFQDGKLDSYGKIDLHSITNVYERLHELKLQVKSKILNDVIKKTQFLYTFIEKRRQIFVFFINLGFVARFKITNYLNFIFICKILINF